MKQILIILVLLTTQPAWAGDQKKPLTQADFAYGMELSVSGRGAIYGLELPTQIYQNCTRPDLGDLRIFNGNNMVPHLLRPQVITKKNRPPVTPPFFPLMAQENNQAIPPNLHISTDSKGTIIDIRQGQGKGISTVVSSYIIDTSAIKQKGDWLQFDWSGSSDHFSTLVRLDTSSDLNNWYPLVHSASLAELSFGGHNLLRNRINLPRGASKYLRISWPAGSKGITLSAVKLSYNAEELNRPRRINSLFAGIQQKNSPPTKPGKKVYYYSSDGFYPVDQLYVRLAQHNAMAQVSVSSRANQKLSWQQRASLLTYQLNIDGVPLQSETQKIKTVTDRFWRIEMKDIDSQAGAPSLELGWLPGQLVFMAQGKQPFTLAYGRAGAKPIGFQVDQLLKDVNLRDKKLIQPARAGAQLILGGDRMLLPTPPGLPWRRWLLWAGLIGGVIIIGSMALQLFREIKKEAG